MLFEQNCHDPICFRKITLAEDKEDRCGGGGGALERERDQRREGQLRVNQLAQQKEVIERNSHTGDREK